jgi:hypothetical protein
MSPQHQHQLTQVDFVRSGLPALWKMSFRFGGYLIISHNSCHFLISLESE